MASLQPMAGPLGERLAAHLLRRSTFGFTASEIASFALKNATQAVTDLLNFPTVPSPPIDPKTGQTWIGSNTTWQNSPEGSLKKYVLVWWLEEAFSTTNLLHKMMLFLHQNFVNDLTTPSVDLYHQLRLFRHYAKGSYKSLAEKACLDNAMLVYLNSQQSTGVNPNENYPRELLELFTIGKGPQVGPGDYTTYTEHDIKEASKLFTGFRVDYSYTHVDTDTNLPRGNPNPWQHDQSTKTFSAAFQNRSIVGRNTDAGMIQEVNEFIDMVFDQNATALNICRKLYRYFVHFKITPEVEQDIIGPLATTLKANNYELDKVLIPLLSSEHFYDMGDITHGDEVIGGVVKSPLDLFMGTMQYFGVHLPDRYNDKDKYYRLFWKDNFFDYLCLESGMDIYNPIDVAGYPAYYQEPAMDDLWVSGSTLSFRYLFADMLLNGTQGLTTNPLHVQMDIIAFLDNANNIPIFQGNNPFGAPGPHPGASIASHLVDTLIEALLPQPLEPSRRSYFLNDLLLDNLSEHNWYIEWTQTYLANGNVSTVKPRVEALIRGIIQSPEYQLA